MYCTKVFIVYITPQDIGIYFHSKRFYYVLLLSFIIVLVLKIKLTLTEKFAVLGQEIYQISILSTELATEEYSHYSARNIMFSVKYRIRDVIPELRIRVRLNGSGSG